MARIKDYTLEAPIGKGRYSTVYRAAKDGTDQKYAIKVVVKKEAGLVAYKGTRKEALLLQNLSHPHVIRVYDCAEEDGALFVVMELLEGGDLFEKISELHCYTEAFAAKLARNLIVVLNYLHSHSVCHRDVKPENLMLRHGKTDAVPPEELHTDVVLVDFGTATKFYGYEEKCAASMTDFMGTPEYMAPEVIQTEIKRCIGYNAKCDIWSTGVVVYILLCGFPPFFAENQQLLFDRIIRGQWSFPPNTVWDRLSPAARDFVSCCLRLDPAERPSAEDLLAHEWLAPEPPTSGDLPSAPSVSFAGEDDEVLGTSFASINLRSAVRNLKNNIDSIKGASKTTGEGLNATRLLDTYNFSSEWEYNQTHPRTGSGTLPYDGSNLLLTFGDEGENAVSPAAPSGEQPEPDRRDRERAERPVASVA